jgi:hypothetical protein
VSVQDEGGSLGSGGSLVSSLELIRTGLNVPWDEWCDTLRVSRQEYSRIVTQKKELSAMSLLKVSECFNLNPSSLVSGTVDITALARTRKGDLNYINPKYTLAGTSQKFTVVNTLDFVAKFRGFHLRNMVNRHFQVNETYWSDWEVPTSERVNIRLLGELWQQLTLNGLTESDFRLIGFHTRLTLRKTEIGSQLSSFGDSYVAYENLVTWLIKRFERNFDYSLESLGEDWCIIRSISNPDMQDALSTQHLGTREGCQVKMGIMASIPTFVGQPAASVHHTHCEHEGSGYCRFFVDFSQLKRPKNGRGAVRLTPIS